MKKKEKRKNEKMKNEKKNPFLLEEKFEFESTILALNQGSIYNKKIFSIGYVDL